MTVLLDPEIAGPPSALNVWVAMHELGHVLGLRHREGSCSLMNAQAYDDACTFTGAGADRARSRAAPPRATWRPPRACTGATRPPAPAADSAHRVGVDGHHDGVANLSCQDCFSGSHSIQK